MDLRLSEINLLAKDLEEFVHCVTKGETSAKALQSYIDDLKGIMLKHIDPALQRDDR